MEARIEVITPLMAELYLTRNTNNYRKYDPKTAIVYAEDMKNGRWEMNGEGIKFSEDGKLLDGQHRLHAIIKAGVPVEMVVITGIPNDVTICDIGKVRSTRQILKANGFSTSVADTSVIGAASLLVQGRFKSYGISKASVMDYLTAHKEDFEAAYRIARNGASSTIAKKSPVILACYLLIRYGADLNVLADFFGVVNSGFPNRFYECSPAIVLRNFLLDARRNAAINPDENRKLQFSMTVSAFYDFASGTRRVKTYKVDSNNLDLLIALRTKDMSQMHSK